MTGRPVSEEEFTALFREFGTAFRLEWQRRPLAFEEAAFGRFRAGAPLLPPEWPEWQGWLDEVQEMTRAGRQLMRVCLTDTPPTPYQRWRIWAAPWHVRAGEGIMFLSRREAAAHGIPARNWWLFDDDRVATMRFTPAGGIGGKTLITAAGTYRRWRDLAVRHATEAVPV